MKKVHLGKYFGLLLASMCLAACGNSTESSEEKTSDITTSETTGTETTESTSTESSESTISPTSSESTTPEEPPHEHVLKNGTIVLGENGEYHYDCETCDEKIVLPLENLDLENSFSGHSWGNWSIEEENTLVGANRAVGDQHWVSSINVGATEDLILDFDVSAESEQVDYAMNIGLGIENAADPGATWMGLNLSFPNTNARVFGKGTDQDDTRCRLVDYNDAGKDSYHVRIEALANHWISYYVDEHPVAIFENTNYNGGYISFCSWNADVTWSNIRYYVGNEYPLTAGVYSLTEGKEVVSKDMSEYKWGNWGLEQDNSIIHGTGAAGDVFYVSNVKMEKVDEFIYEADIKSSDTCGLVFGIQNQADPGASWLCLNTNWDSSKAFCAGGANPVNDFGGEVYKNYEHKRTNSIRRLKITATNNEDGSKHFKYEACGILVHEVNVNTYIGGYLGVMAFLGDSYFINPTVTLLNK